MKKIYISFLAIVAFAVYYVVFISAKPANNITYIGDAMSVGTEGDADGRMQYEWMLLHDPATGKIPAYIRERELAFAAHLPTDMPAFGAAQRTTTATITWQQRGPWNVGGRTRAMAVDVSKESCIVAGSCSGGMWRTTDGGLTWTQTNPVNNYQSVSCLAQDTRTGHTNVWYYGSGEAYGASASANGAYYLGNGVFKSTDSGKTWNVLPSTVGAHLTTFDKWADISWNIVTNSADTINDVVYDAAYGGIYRSINGGTTWTLVKGTFGSVSGDSYFTDIAISKTGVIYAALSSDGVQRGIYRSVNGTTFTNILPTGFPTTYNRIKIGISPADENQVYFLCNTPGAGMPDTNFLGDIEWNSLYKYYYDSGTGAGTGGVWRNLSANLPIAGGVFDKYTCQGSYDMVIKPKPDDTSIVFLGGTNLYRSTSGFNDNTHTTFIGGYQYGASLPVVNLYLNHHPDQHELAFLPSNPLKMISSNDGGVFRTDNDTAGTLVWHSLNNGYINTMFYTCAIDHALTNDIIIGGAQDNGSWYTNSPLLSVPWVTPNGGDGSYCAIADSGKVYYFSIQQGKVRKMILNSSGVMDSFARIDPIGGKGYQFINPFLLDPNNNNIMYLAGGKYLWRNDNLAGIPFAGNWDSISTNWVQFPDSVPTALATITCVSVSKIPANRVYFGTSSQKVYRIDSANIGTHTPVALVAPLFPGGATVSCVAVDPLNADSIIVVFSNYGVLSLFLSGDGGTTWHKIGGNLEANNNTGAGDGPSCRWAQILHPAGGTVYMVGTSVGLFSTTVLNDTFTVWTQLGASNIGASVVDMIDYRMIDGLTTIATHSHGIFSAHITSVTDVVDAAKNLAGNTAEFELINYPNPFHGSTNFKFTLKENAMVSLAVYDLSGRLVKTLANEAMDAGEKIYNFDGEQLLPGVYYCVLNAGRDSKTVKMIVY